MKRFATIVWWLLCFTAFVFLAFSCFAEAIWYRNWWFYHNHRGLTGYVFPWYLNVALSVYLAIIARTYWRNSKKVAA